MFGNDNQIFPLTKCALSTIIKWKILKALQHKVYKLKWNVYKLVDFNQWRSRDFSLREARFKDNIKQK